jgi:hypothetical protein
MCWHVVMCMRGPRAAFGHVVYSEAFELQMEQYGVPAGVTARTKLSDHVRINLCIFLIFM